jgi:hypothetical protein
MHVRSISNLIHTNSKFYAQNVSILPVYNKIFTEERPKFKPQGFDGKTCTVDPDLPIYRNHWIQYNAEALREAFELFSKYEWRKNEYESNRMDAYGFISKRSL